MEQPTPPDVTRKKAAAAELSAPEAFAAAPRPACPRPGAFAVAYSAGSRTGLACISPEILLRAADAGVLRMKSGALWKTPANRSARRNCRANCCRRRSLELVAWLCLPWPSAIASTWPRRTGWPSCVLKPARKPGHGRRGPHARFRKPPCATPLRPGLAVAAPQAMGEQQRRFCPAPANRQPVPRHQQRRAGAAGRQAVAEREQALQERSALSPARLTSRRSYHARQAQLHKLITEEIPANSREIGVARGYGDLRENFEYKAAKIPRAWLMRRRMEWEQMLAEVRATDFANFTDRVAYSGYYVTLRYDDGREENTILGSDQA